MNYTKRYTYHLCGGNGFQNKMAEISIMQRVISVKGEHSHLDFLKFSEQPHFSRTVKRNRCVAQKAT